MDVSLSSLSKINKEKKKEVVYEMEAFRNTSRWKNLGTPCWPLEKDGNSGVGELLIWRE